MPSRVASLLAFLVLVLAPGATTPPAVAQPVPIEASFGATYAELAPGQKHLVDDWARRLVELTRRSVATEELYDSLPLSIKTTFGAVTHALLRTTLTTETGEALGPSALALVARLDAVRGMVPGARGDQQFRIYVQLSPDALQVLDRAKEFARTADNTVYHKGYPICFRSRGGVPSIQVSISRDGTLADIDVDYRSSKFPVMLVNGHLASSNSDVRAGNNDERHNNRWTGLNNWWRDLLGLLSVDQPPAGDGGVTRFPATPKVPRGARPEVAVHDFLTTWLVDRQPAEVIPYFTDEAVACMALQSDKPIDRGMSRIQIFLSLQESNTRIGAVAALGEAIEAVEMPASRSRLRRQPHGEFVLYDVREDAAEQLKCSNRLDPSQIDGTALKSTSYGKYVGAVFRMKKGPRAGRTFATLWTRIGGYWRLIAYSDDPQAEIARALNLPVTAISVPTPPLVDADPSLTRATRGFLEQWFVKGNLDAAMRHLSPKVYPCVNAYLDDGVAPARSEGEQRDLLRRGMIRVSDRGRRASRLADVIVAPDVSHPDVKVVRQKDATAYAMFAIPDSMFAECGTRPAETIPPSAASDTPLAYGTYYATAFKLAATLEDAAVIAFVWTKEGGAWKIVAFTVLTA